MGGAEPGRHTRPPLRPILLFVAGLLLIGMTWFHAAEIQRLDQGIARLQARLLHENAERVRHARRVQEEEQEEIARRNRISETVQKSLVFVTSPDEAGQERFLGTGSFVGSGGEILTADHVAGEGAGLVGYYQENDAWSTGPLELVRRRPERDLAVLRAPLAGLPRPRFLPEAPRRFQPGHEYQIWAPILQRSDLPRFQALPFRTWCFGEDDYALFVQLVLLPGCSGSPVLNEKGEIGAVYVGARRIGVEAIPLQVKESRPTTEAAPMTVEQPLVLEYGRAARIGE